MITPTLPQLSTDCKQSVHVFFVESNSYEHLYGTKQHSIIALETDTPLRPGSAGSGVKLHRELILIQCRHVMAYVPQ